MSIEAAAKIACLAGLIAVMAVILSMAGCDTIDAELDYQDSKLRNWAETECDRSTHPDDPACELARNLQ